MGNSVILALKVESSDILINFCTIIRALFLWKNQQTVGKLPYNAEEISKIKGIYQDSLEKLRSEFGYALVDISNGDIINPSRISNFHILNEYEGPLPF
ncbi:MULTISPECIES: hypothetical protein [Bacillaceae]|nr:MULTISPECIES: hypothetical protein [Bacillaceae]